jgi:hypothetical protein
MSTALQAFDNDGLSLFAGIDHAGSATAKGTHNRSACCVAVIIGCAQQRTGPCPQGSGTSRFPVKLPLTAGKVLAGGKINLVSGIRATIENGYVIGPSVGAGCQQDGQRGSKIYWFHLYFP